MPNRRNQRDTSFHPWNATLFGTLWEVRGPVGLLHPAEAGHSFKFHVSEIVEFGKLRAIDKAAVQNFIRVGDGSIYRVAFATQTRAGRIWISLHAGRCRCPSLFAPDGVSRRLQSMVWMPALTAADIPDAEVESFISNFA